MLNDRGDFDSDDLLLLGEHHHSILVAAAVVAVWCTISLTVRIFTVLNRRSGLCFYGLLFSSMAFPFDRLTS